MAAPEILESKPSDVLVALRFTDTGDALERGPTLIDVTSALYDFELTYEAALLVWQEQDVSYERFFMVGRNRPLDREYQLRVARVAHESPLLFLGHIPWTVIATGALWPIYKTIELVYTADVRLRVARKELLVREARATQQLLETNETIKRLTERQRNQQVQLEDVEIIELPPPS